MSATVLRIVNEKRSVLFSGSQNSSNSQRLRELAETDASIAAHLIYGKADMRKEWFEGVESVLVTAGASAPETVVEECIEWMKEKYGATVEPVMIREENVNFPLPKKLRQLQG